MGDADAAVEARIRIGWNKFRQLGPLLTNKDVSLIIVCEAACCMEVRPGLQGKKMWWHFSKKR